VTRILRIGVVGCGAIAQIMHLPHLRDLSDRFVVAALCDLDAARLQLVADHYRVASRSTEWRRLLDEPLDAVAVLSSGDHSQIVLAALERGLHVFVEKPLAYTQRQTDAIGEAAERAGRTVMVGMHKRFDPAYRLAAQQVAQMPDLRLVDAVVVNVDDPAYFTHHALLGIPPHREPELPLTPAEVAGRVLSGAPRNLIEAQLGARADEDLVAGQLLMSSAIHDIDILRGIVGEPTGVVSAHHWASGTSFAAVIAFPGDVRAAYAWTSVPGVRHYRETFDFIGQSSRVRLDFPSPYLRNAPTALEIEEGRGDELRTTRIVASYQEAFLRELAHFHESVVSGRPPLTGVPDARRNLDLLTAIGAAMTS